MTKLDTPPLVSIITPVHNDGKYIGATANSVLRQSMENFEWLLIDDASTSETASALAALAARDSRIRVITKTVNEGPARARNTGVHQACGKFIAFLDADDIWDSRKLERQSRFMQDNSVDFCYHDYVSFEDGSGRPLALITGPDQLTLFAHNTRRGVGCLTVMLRRSITSPTLFPPLPSGIVAEDFAAWAALVKAGIKGRRLPESLAWYRVRKRSFSSNKLRSARSVWFIMRTLEGLGKASSTFFFVCFASTAFLSRITTRVTASKRALASPPWH